MKRSASAQHSCDAKKMRKSPPTQQTVTSGRLASCLPAEVLLDIVHCVDFNTLVSLRFASHTFNSIVHKKAGVLAKRRRMELMIDDDSLTLSEGKTGPEFPYDPRKPFTCVDAMRRVASHLGCHSLTTLCIADNWRRVPIKHLLYAAPALRYVETLQIGIADRRNRRITSVDDVNRFLRYFSRLRRFHLYAPGKPIFDWSAFLRSEGVLTLPELVAGLIFNVHVKGRSSAPRDMDFLRYSFDCTRLAEGVGKFVKLPSQLDASAEAVTRGFRKLSELLSCPTEGCKFTSKSEAGLHVHVGRMHKRKDSERQFTEEAAHGDASKENKKPAAQVAVSSVEGPLSDA